MSDIVRTPRTDDIVLQNHKDEGWILGWILVEHLNRDVEVADRVSPLRRKYCDNVMFYHLSRSIRGSLI
jgi:hypothetical protein